MWAWLVGDPLGKVWRKSSATPATRSWDDFEGEHGHRNKCKRRRSAGKMMGKENGQGKSATSAKKSKETVLGGPDGMKFGGL
jgi:hypothetical protein